jgi:hypothetical protein
MMATPITDPTPKSRTATIAVGLPPGSKTSAKDLKVSNGLSWPGKKSGAFASRLNCNIIGCTQGRKISTDSPVARNQPRKLSRPMTRLNSKNAGRTKMEK